MTYAIFDKDNKRVSDACQSESRAWYCLSLELQRSPVHDIAIFASVAKGQGYTCQKGVFVREEVYQEVMREGDLNNMRQDLYDELKQAGEQA